MSRNCIILVSVIATIVLLLMPVVIAEENNTTSTAQRFTPVVKAGGSSSLTVEDANMSEADYSIYDSIYGTSPHISVITAQLYLDGKPYNRSDIPITFTSDNDSIAVLEPMNRTRPSDEHGQAKILLISNNTVGKVNITASSRISISREIRDTCTVYVVGWGTVSGMVTDKNQNGVPYAKMTLWAWNGTANTGILLSSDNPQLTNDGSTAAIGTYTFTYVPVGTYNLTAEKDGHVYFAMVYMTVGTYTANVAFPDYVFPGFIKPTTVPTPTEVPTPVSTSTRTPTPTPSPAPGMGITIALLSMICALAWVTLKQGK